MNRRLAAALALSVALSACKRAAPDPTPTKEIAGGVEMIDYDAAQGTFSCRAPRSWGVRETKVKASDCATFVGPRDARTDGSSYITIMRYPESAPQWTDAEKYAESFWKLDPRGKKPEIARENIGGAVVLRFHQERPFRKLHESKAGYMLRYDYALVPVKGGFYEIEHRAPASAYAATLPVFEAVVRSFKPKI